MPVNESPELIHDWQLEVANQIFGCIKARISTFKIIVEASIPIYASGTEFNELSKCVGPITSCSFSRDNLSLNVSFCGVFTSGVTFSDQDSDSGVLIGNMGDATIF